MISIRWLNADPIMDLKRANLSTIRKRPKDAKMSPEKFWKMLVAEHSTLRFLSLEVFDDDIPYSVAMQVVRHTKDHCQHEVSSGRPDWTGKERDYSQTRWYLGKYTPIGIIRMMEQRICDKAEDATRDWAQQLRSVMLEHDCPYIRTLADLCQPKCERTEFCHELVSCGRYPTVEY